MDSVLETEKGDVLRRVQASVSRATESHIIRRQMTITCGHKQGNFSGAESMLK